MSNSSRDSSSIGETLTKLWLYGTAFFGNCSCLVLLVLFFAMGSFITKVGEIVWTETSDISSTKNEEIISSEATENKIVVVPVHGVISDALANDFLGKAEEGAEASRIIAQLDDALVDTNVKAIILDINSPGGSVVASDKVYQKVKYIVQEKKKPVVALFGEVAASGGYYISAPSSAIVANAAAFTGSIGVIMSLTNVEELFAKIGIKEQTFKSATHKDIGSGTRQITDEERSILQTLIDEAYGEFKYIVQEGRGLSDQELQKVVDGRIFSGKQAKELKLVDEIGNLGTAILIAKEKAGIDKAEVVQYKGASFLENLLDSLSIKKQFEVSLFGSKTSGNTITSQSSLFYLWDGHSL